MTWIEGVGDEVTIFFALLAIVLVGTIAWLSTNIGEQPVIRTVLLVERWNPHSHESGEPAVAVGTGGVGSGVTNGDVDSATQDAIYAAVHSGCECEEAVPIIATVPDSTSLPDASITPENVTVPESADVLPELRRRRLLLPEGTDQPEASPSEQEQVEGESGIEADPEVVPPGHIWIRLKYLNDDQKLVQGRLEEPLGDFKRRHFTTELTADNLVRLIFNGHILQRDADTLRSYGLFDNCVVHCLVHQQRARAESAYSSAQASEAQAAADNNPEWNIGTILPVLLVLLIGMAWYCRFQYSHLFSATTSVTLVGLTGILAVSLLGIYLPGQDPANPVP